MTNASPSRSPPDVKESPYRDAATELLLTSASFSESISTPSGPWGLTDERAKSEPQMVGYKFVNIRHVSSA
ncbi:hypothetical protein M3D15_01950 [Pseudoclavibacter alba]|uniref:Uncharacterized protein n=1 Tax=Pseudoclavibacter albus TaxID=272241 RepID=A0ABT2HUW5_9MICO|nr:hypothetical protein [Pseudoclavibacter alba]MCT2042107.1 hypothetical protein [Pseudoclavibacter alba]